jgi:adenine-specific DNA-methyltransferase
MNSLLVKEGMAGKVQMIYMDPPYGIKYASNFQPRIDRRDVKDKDEDLTHEPEQIKAYRDTWTLGIHSYLTYLRDRLLLCRELLSESGSIFVQINDENLHLVRCLLDEVFGRENFVAVVAFRKTGGLIRKFLPGTFDFLLWYARDRGQAKFNPLYLQKADYAAEQYRYLLLPDGLIRALGNAEELPAGARIFQPTTLESANPVVAFEYRGKTYRQRWKTNLDGLRRLAEAERIFVGGMTLRYVRFLDDFAVVPLTDIWDDTMGEREMLYAVQTNTKVVERCILMTTDPGDLVFDPTCGSGTTAWCAEKWGRRWITCDTSRVALAIARQR